MRYENSSPRGSCLGLKKTFLPPAGYMCGNSHVFLRCGPAACRLSYKDGDFSPIFREIRLLTICERNFNNRGGGWGIIAFAEYPGVAQLVARLLWEQDAGGSSPSTRTKTPLKSMISEGFSYSLAIVVQNLHYFILKQFILYPWARPCVVSNPFC